MNEAISPLDDTLIGPHNLDSINSPPPITNAIHYCYPPAHLASIYPSESNKSIEEKSNSVEEYAIIMPVNKNKQKKSNDEEGKSSNNSFYSTTCCSTLTGIMLFPFAPILCMVTGHGKVINKNMKQDSSA